MRTLIVEDDLMSQCVLAKVLTDRGHEVVSFDNAEKAILAHQKQFFPLIFVDVGLPGMDGLQFCKWVRSQPKGDQAFIMVATAPNQPSDFRQVLEAGANDFLPKPYEITSLDVRLTVAERQMTDFFERKKIDASLQESKATSDRLTAELNNTVQTLEGEKTDRARVEQARQKLEGDLDARVRQHETDKAKAAEQFKAEAASRKSVEAQLARTQAELSARVEQLTGELTQTRESLQAESKARAQAEGQLKATRAELESLTAERAETVARLEKALESEKKERGRLAETLQKAQADWEAKAGQHAADLAKADTAFQTETTGRKRLEEALQKSHADTEARNRQHAEQLANAGKALEAEAAERKRLAESLQKTQQELDARTQDFTGQLARLREEVKNQTAERDRAEQELRKVREDLAARLKEHTTELLKAGQELKAEMAERKRVDEEVLSARAELARVVKEHTAEMVKAGEELKAGLAARKRAEDAATKAHEEIELRFDAQSNDLARAREQLEAGASERKQLEQTLQKTREESDVRLRERTAELAKLGEELKQRAAEAGQAQEQLKSEANARRRAEEALEQLRRELEQRVQDSTARLTKANEELTERASQSARSLNDLQARTGGLDRANDGLQKELALSKRAAARSATFARLGRDLNAARTAIDTARVVASAAHELVSWDACSVDLYARETNRIDPILNIEMISGHPADVPPTVPGPAPTPILTRVLERGPQLVLRAGASASHTDYVLYGDRARLAVSMMFVAIKAAGAPIGFLSVHSYAAQAYDEEALAALQNLADHCGGALERIRLETMAVQAPAREVSSSESQSLAAFAQCNPNPVFAFDADGNLTLFNDAAAAMARSLGKEHPSMILPPDASGIAQRCLATGEQKSHLETVVEGRTLHWSFFPILASRTVHGCAVDVTDRLNLESQSRQAQKMESLSQFSAGIAHDFNNVLNVIQGYSVILGESPDVKPESAEALKEITTATDRAAHLTRQLLAFSRRQSLDVRPVELNGLINNLGAELRRVLGESVAVQFNFAATLPPVDGDPGLIEQVVINLAANARDAMPNGGQLTLITKAVEIDDAHVKRNRQARTGRFACLSVADTGVGMDDATSRRIFEPFFSTKPAGKGTGLGLATVYGIVKQHRGWIDVQSQPGQGATFHVYLPVSARGADTTPEPADRPAVRGGTETILVVEDEPAVLNLALTTLKRHGYQVLPAPSGDDALPVWREHSERIDLLLTDIVMPGSLSGHELAEKLCAEKPGLKVVYMSGYSRELLGKGLPQRRDFVFVQKPYHPDALARAVRDCLDGKPA